MRQRRVDENVSIGESIVVNVLDIPPNRVNLGFTVPADIGIFQVELMLKSRENCPAGDDASEASLQAHPRKNQKTR